MAELTDWDSYLESSVPVILQAGASWCGPCNTLKPMLTEAAGQYEGKVKYVYCDVDKFPQVAQMLEITSIPQTYMIVNGDLVDEFGGVPRSQGDLTKFFDKALSVASGETPTRTQSPEEEQGEIIFREGQFSVAVLNDGIGETVPKGAKVKVHYTGKLTNGKVFDSSVPRGQPLEFVVGMGQVIKGWDVGICKLQKAQKAIITCPPDWAYGSRAMGPIPANSTLIFEVEVIDF